MVCSTKACASLKNHKHTWAGWRCAEACVCFGCCTNGLDNLLRCLCILCRHASSASYSCVDLLLSDCLAPESAHPLSSPLHLSACVPDDTVLSQETAHHTCVRALTILRAISLVNFVSSDHIASSEPEKMCCTCATIVVNALSHR